MLLDPAPRKRELRARLTGTMKLVVAVTSIVVSISYTGSLAFASCKFDLETLGECAEDAAFEARQADSACQQFDSCRQFPETFDLLRNGCSDDREQCASATRRLGNALQTVDSAINGVRASCGLTSEAVGTKKPARGGKSLPKPPNQ